MADVDQLTVGEAIDLCIEHSNLTRSNEAEPRRRKATQDDINSFFG